MTPENQENNGAWPSYFEASILSIRAKYDALGQSDAEPKFPEPEVKRKRRIGK